MRPHNIINRTHLAHQMAYLTGFSVKNSLKDLDAFIAVVTYDLQHGKPIYLYGFGHFMIHKVPSHGLHDLRSGKITRIPEMRTPTFYASRVLKAKCHHNHT